MPQSCSGSRPPIFDRPELDVLRLVAFAMVFAHHWLPHDASAYPNVPALLATTLASSAYGFGRGVDLFFVLSAYLITELLVREIRQRGDLNIKAFLARRALRIWPLYFFLIALCVRPIPFLHHESLSDYHLMGMLFFVGNWTTAFYGYPWSAAAVLWSVSIEEQFYVCWPFLVRRVTRTQLAQIIVAMIVVAALTRVYLAAVNARDPSIWVNSFARLDLFAAGASLSLLLEGRVPTLSKGRRISLMLSGMGVLVFLGYLRIDDGWGSVLGYSVAAAACTLIVFGTLGSARAGGSPLAILRYFGRISYGLYMFHALALHWIAEHFGAHGTLLQGASAMLLTACLASASHRVIERPFLSLKHRFTVIPTRPG